ncbi:MAG: tRNA (adenosine(37)-N6)-dimethylallyltransferase MiaA, partial [Pseudomonadota bacterium]
MHAPVIAIMGPTACGKTAVAMALCEALNAEIISVDSAMVFRGMDIGTAKPTADELAQAPHRLIDIVDPDEVYSAGQFRRDALHEVEALKAEGKNAVLAGGTMLYFRALLTGIDALPDADETVRAAIDAQAAEAGWPAMHDRLNAVDPDAAARIHPNDAQRIQRALEVHTLTGRPLSSLQREGTGPPPWPVIRIGLLPADRAALHA